MPIGLSLLKILEMVSRSYDHYMKGGWSHQSMFAQNTQFINCSLPQPTSGNAWKYQLVTSPLSIPGMLDLESACCQNDLLENDKLLH